MPRFPLPFGGLNDNEAYGDQPAETTREMINMRTVDPSTGRRRISQRSGLSKYNASQVSGTNPIKHLAPRFDLLLGRQLRQLPRLGLVLRRRQFVSTIVDV